VLQRVAELSPEFSSSAYMTDTQLSRLKRIPDILHHHDQRQAPGGHFHGTALGGIEIGKELILIKCAELRAQVHIEGAFGKGSPHCSSGRIGNRWERFRA
jgi:hypothetical protein